MPVACRVDAEQGVTFIEVWGLFSSADVMTGREQLKADPAFSVDMDQLIDMRRVTDFAPTTELKEWADSYPFDSKARRAFVTPEDLAYGTMRMYQALTDHPQSQTRVFREMSEACQWLEIKPPE